MTGAPREALSKDPLLTRHPRTQRTIAGLVSITPEPPRQPRMLPSPPQQSPAPSAAARLAMAAASEASLEVGMASPSIELAWRVVQAAESRKALLDQRALSLRVRRTVPPPALNTTFPSQKASMSPHYRESCEDGSRGGVRPPLPSYGGPLAARQRPPGGFPLLQVSSWLRDDAELPELRECEQDSPFSTALLERSTGGLRKRRPLPHPQRVIHQEDEEAMSGDFSVSGVRLGTQHQGGSRLAPDLNALKAKKAFAAQSPWRHADPAALAEALTIALGQLQQSSWNEAEEELGEESHRTSEIEDAAAAPQPRPRKLAPVRIQEELLEGTLDGDDSPSATWPPGAKRRARTQAPARALIIRSKSLPGEKAEKAAEKATEKEKEKEKAPNLEKRAGPPNEEDRQAAPEKSQSEKSDRGDPRVTYDKAKRPNKPLTLVKSEKSSTGTSNSKSKSKKAGAKKMVLPFAYCFDDPRYWHVESTEGRACPEFLPENRA